MIRALPRDWVDWVLFVTQVVSLIGTLLAVVLAVVQIKRARAEAAAAQKTQLKERRIDFDLTVLRELLVAAAQGDALRVQALASTLPEEVVPITRAAAMLPSTEKGDRMVTRLLRPRGTTHPATLYLDGLKKEVRDELVQAIAERVHERAPAG